MFETMPLQGSVKLQFTRCFETLHRCLVARLSHSKTSRESWWRIWTCPRNVCLSVETVHREPKFQMIAYHQIHVTSTPTTSNFWVSGHVGSSSCPAGPLEEALRGVDLVPSRIVHGLTGSWQSRGFNPKKSPRSPLVFASHRQFETPSGSKSFCPTVMSWHYDTTRQRHRFGKKML